MAALEPPPDCSVCPRLVRFREETRTQNPRWHNAPVNAFGPETGRLLIVGLAPGLRGANRTGRPFSGDFAGDLLYPTLQRFGFAAGTYAARRDDGLRLRDCRVTNAVRCVPPKNKPTSTEVNSCRQFLAVEISALARLKIVLALGRIAHDTLVRLFKARPGETRFRHGVFHDLENGLTLADCYHCSRYNTNTGRLTEEMFAAVFAAIRERLA